MVDGIQALQLSEPPVVPVPKAPRRKVKTAVKKEAVGVIVDLDEIDAPVVSVVKDEDYASDSGWRLRAIWRRRVLWQLGGWLDYPLWGDQGKTDGKIEANIWADSGCGDSKMKDVFEESDDEGDVIEEK